MTKGETPFDVVDCFDLPESPDPYTVYRLLPKNPDEEFYRERIDRNIGWITKEEQKMLRTKAIGIAGCGGMGGLLAQIFIRLGIGEIHIADCEVFDVSNLNRQFAAARGTIGVSKAFSPPLLYTATHLSRLLLLCGHTLATSTNFTRFSAIGFTHLNLSSLIVFAILIAISPF